MVMKTTISPFLFELNGLSTVLLPQDGSFHFLMDLFQFNFQNKKIVNLSFFLDHCFSYCMKMNILRFLLLWEMEINFFYFYYSVVFCTCKLQKNVMQSNFSMSDIPNPLAVYCFPCQVIYFVIKKIWASIFMHTVCF